MVATSSASSRASTGLVFDISRGCVDDGPGLRTVVFLKGCHLDCRWCHNPEGKDRAPLIAFRARQCMGCGRCSEVCHRLWKAGSWREGCTRCGACASVCPSGARTLVGRTMKASELLQEVMNDRDFFSGTGGGVTFSGGEPMVQASFVFEVADELRSLGVHTAVETAGFWPGRHVEPLSVKTDLVIFDLKHVVAEKFQNYLGADYGVALDNLQELIASQVELEIRITLVPGFNDTEADLEAIAAWLRSKAPQLPIRLQAYHRLAAAKEEIFETSYAYNHVAPLSRERLSSAVSFLRDAELDVGVG